MPAVTLDLTPHERAFSADASAIDATARTASVIFATETPILDFDRSVGEFYSVLSCTPQAADLSRLNAGGAFLREHDRSLQPGVFLKASADADKMCRGLVKFSRSPVGEQEFQDYQDGIRSLTSISYQPRSMTLMKAGTDNTPPTYLVDKWEALEVSSVSVPADPNCRVSRAQPDPNAPKAAVTITIPDSLRSQYEAMPPKYRSLKFNAPDNGGGSGGGAATAPELTPEARALIKKEGQEDERTRCNGINEWVEFFAKANKNTRSAADQFIKDGKSPEDFRRHVMSDAFTAEPIDLTVVNDLPVSGATPQGNRALSRSSGLSVGAQFITSRQVQAVKGKRLERGQSVSIDIADCTMLGARGKASLNARQRAGFTSGDLAAINIQVLPGMVELGMQRLTIMDLLTGGATTAAALPYAKENGFGTINGQPFAAGTYPRGQAVGEGQLKPTWDPDLTTDLASVKKIAVTTKVPDEFLSDFAGMQSYIDGRLPYMVDLETEFELLYGSGQNNQLKGIFTTAGIQSRNIDTSSETAVAMSLRKGLTDVSVGAQFEPTGYGFHPYDWETAQLLRDANGRFFAGGPFYIPYGDGVFVEMYTFWGKPVVVSTSINLGKPVTGSWKLGAQYFMREGMRLEMTNSNEDDFRRNLIAMRAEHRLALAVYRPVAFLEFQGFPART